MAAAYASLASLKFIIYQLQTHPFPPISIDKQQVESLTEIVAFLLNFLKAYNSPFADTEEADPLETRIADAAYKAEDVIESKIVDQIHSRSTADEKTIALGDDFYHDLQRVIEEMDSIKEVAKTIETNKPAVQPQLRKNASTAVGSSKSSSTAMVGFDGVLRQILDKLTTERCLQVLPITGMGGIGKTTLARNVFDNALIKELFHVRAWTTISQTYNARQTFRELLSLGKEDSSDMSVDDLGKKLYQNLSGKKYLIIIDDLWSTTVWDEMKHFFPDYNNGSRIIVTTRLSNLTSHFAKHHSFSMQLLDEVSSWSLFSKTVFGEESFPLELKEIGKKIVRNCRGLPLSIVSIGGLLGTSVHTLEHWERVEGNLSSMVNSNDDDYCLRILKMSYNHLPVHLKSCFLYMGVVFEEDCEISVSTLIRLWVLEGFLEPTSGKSLETVAEENLKALVDRNLILVHKLGSMGKIKYCKIHDLLRDLCLREAKVERFYHALGKHTPQGIYNARGIAIDRSTSEEEAREALESVSHARSVISHYSWKYVFQSVNLRYLVVIARKSQFPSSIGLLWNLQTLISYDGNIIPIEIWNMPHLRHVKINMHLPDPPPDNVVIMENLQTLKTVHNLKLSEEVVKRIPNIKQLHLEYEEINWDDDCYCLHNLELLHKLESFHCYSSFLLKKSGFLKKLVFPKSLKKLVLRPMKNFHWEDIFEKIGSLPSLEVLQLLLGSFRTREWRTVKGQFRNLRVLLLNSCDDLEQWTTEISHFPRLEKITLIDLRELKEIPCEIGDIPTLQAIELVNCRVSVGMSAKEIADEKEEGEIQVRVVTGHIEIKIEKLVVCSESECEGEGGYLNEEGKVITQPQKLQPHFHSHKVVVKDREALQRFAWPSFKCVSYKHIQRLRI